MVNFSISSSGSQSIRHTSSAKCIRVAYGNTVAGIVPYAFASFSLAFASQRPVYSVCSSVCQGCQTLVHISGHASPLRAKDLVNCCCYSLLFRPPAPMQSPHHPTQVCWQVPGGSLQSVMANHVMKKSQDGPNCAGVPMIQARGQLEHAWSLPLLTALFTIIAFSTVYKTERRLYHAVLECVNIHKCICLIQSLFICWDRTKVT